MGGGTTTQATQSQQVNSIPQWVSNAGQQNYAFAQNVANQPLQQYQGQMLADVAPQTQQAWNLAASSGGVGQDQYAGSQAGYLNALGQRPNNVTAAQSALAPGITAATGGKAATSGLTQSALAAPTTAQQSGLSQLSNTNLQPYMSPYTQAVIDKTLPIMQQGLALSQNQQQNAANSANAFGGSRQAIQQGVTQAQGALAQEQMAAQLNQANFAQAQAAGQSDVAAANNMGQFNVNQANQVGLANMAAANNMGQFNATAANNMGQFNAGALNNMAQFGATAQNAAALANMTAANNMGQFNTTARNAIAQGNQSAQQARINSDIQASQGLANLGDSQAKANAANYTMLSQAGAGQQSQAQDQINSQMAKFQQANSYPQQQLATLLSALGMTPHDTATTGSSTTQTTTPTNWGALALGGLEDLSGFFKSDRTTKTDIKKLGKDRKTGLPLYSFRYKEDPKTYPKVVGPMAQDVEKQFPGATKRIGGKLAVHSSVMPDVPGYAMGTAKVPGVLASTDTVPAMLTPGEAVLNQRAATKLGRGTIAQLNTGTPPSSPLVAKGLKPMQQGRTLASFMPPKKTFSGFGGGTPTGRIRLRGALA